MDAQFTTSVCGPLRIQIDHARNHTLVVVTKAVEMPTVTCTGRVMRVMTLDLIKASEQGKIDCVAHLIKQRQQATFVHIITVRVDPACAIAT